MKEKKRLYFPMIRYKVNREMRMMATTITNVCSKQELLTNSLVVGIIDRPIPAVTTNNFMWPSIN